ncbi:MAG: hypothetical protein G01um101470_860 [Parcubacteria group bacterium Gr01-1014_70]|nr:MAG: hypothetical protein G01um101470_860 [Parcubacteria group bacterium Gr01-1014_70]
MTAGFRDINATCVALKLTSMMRNMIVGVTIVYQNALDVAKRKQSVLASRFTTSPEIYGCTSVDEWKYFFAKRIEKTPHP